MPLVIGKENSTLREVRKMGEVMSVNEAKARTLMVIIEMMIARYRKHHHSNLDEEMFRLFEKAKVVNWAQNSCDMNMVIKNI